MYAYLSAGLVLGTYSLSNIRIVTVEACSVVLLTSNPFSMWEDYEDLLMFLKIPFTFWAMQILLPS